ncbi:MAG TPA: TauD/TfdA family dioxygenase [Burkholderiaceae bacterium]|nr:TauD/TfdA family dioxygenase [Burkholderiaceae bacterium]
MIETPHSLLHPQSHPAGLLDSGSGVKLSMLPGAERLPLVIEPARPGLDAPAWAARHRDAVEEALKRWGAVLFRGFALSSPTHFESFAEALSPGLYGQYGDLPKNEAGSNIYRSTPYPEQQMILFHNESSHMPSWPRRHWFFCEWPSHAGGATPLVDVREMVRRMPAGLAGRFERKGLLYIRTFNQDLDVSWQDFFKTGDRAAVEARCRACGMDFAWLDRGDLLQTRTLCHAIVRHPDTGERVFFNQIQLHHPSCLGEAMREDLLDLVGLERLPRNVLYGDGSPIDDETMALLGRCYEECAVRFRWQQGDVVMLDNMLAAHARDPYEGPRKIVVAMGRMMSRSELPPISHDRRP